MKDNSKTPSDCQTLVFVVYVIWCRQTNMHYVGVTGQSVWERIRQHKKGKKQFIDLEIRRLGWEGNFDWWIVEENVPANLISEREQHWVSFFDCAYPNGYNKTHGGIGHFKHLKKTCEQMSESHRGKKRAPFTDEHKANIAAARTGKKGAPAWNKGIPCTDEAKDKIRRKLTGRKRPDQSERMKGENNPNFGKHLSDETKAKMGESKRGKTPWNKGVPHSEETKALIREKALARNAAKRAAKAAQMTP